MTEEVVGTILAKKLKVYCSNIWIVKCIEKDAQRYI